MDSPHQWEPASVNGKWRDKILTRKRRRRRRLRPAAEDAEALRTNPEWIPASQSAFRLFLIGSGFFPLFFFFISAAVKMSEMGGRRANANGGWTGARPSARPV